MEAERRRQLVSELRRKGITDPAVLAAIERVPRERFVLPEHRGVAYEDVALPLTEGQTISQPYVVALMTRALGLTGTETVLEIGTGSGYQTAVLAELAARVVSVEWVERLARAAAALLAELGYANVQVEVGNGSLGWPAEAPYDAIIVTAGAPRVPEALPRELKEGGRLVLPVGTRDAQRLLCLVRHGDRVERQDLGEVRFVPLLGEQGWQAKARVD